LKDGAASDDALRAELPETVEKRLAGYKARRFIEFVADLPKTATGKIQRFRLRE
jgi:benzoate-CoA ligase